MSTKFGTRKYIDCGEFPSDTNCSLKISGTEDEVLAAAVQHAVSSHGHSDSEELRTSLRGALKSEAGATEVQA
jgi:predicted small metal-binding protein